MTSSRWRGRSHRRELPPRAGAVWRHATDRLRHRRGTRLLMGNALAARLFYSLRQRKVPIWLNASLRELTIADGRVTGAVLSVDGETRRVTARRAVVLATGGFGGSVERLNEYVRPPLKHAVAFAGARGRGHDGGARGRRCRRGRSRAAGVLDAGVGDRMAGRRARRLSASRARPRQARSDRGQRAGRRFVDEAVSYHEFVVGMHRSHETVPTIPAWLVCDRAFIERYGLGRVPPGRRSWRKLIASGYLIEADTLDALATKIKVDAAGLRDSVARNNRSAETGIDEDFGKGSTDFDRHNGDPGHTPNPARADRTPPYYAMAVYPSTLGSSVGLKTDADGRVLSASGAPIPGLYACGNDMASIMRGHYPGPGITLGPGMVFAYRAAMAIARTKT